MLYQQQQQNKHCDAQLLTSDGCLLGVHAAVVSAASPAIDAVLDAEAGTCPTLQTPVPQSVLEPLLELLYTGQVKSGLGEDKVQDIRQASMDLGMNIWPALLEKRPDENDSSAENDHAYAGDLQMPGWEEAVCGRVSEDHMKTDEVDKEEDATGSERHRDRQTGNITQQNMPYAEGHSDIMQPDMPYAEGHSDTTTQPDMLYAEGRSDTTQPDMPCAKGCTERQIGGISLPDRPFMCEICSRTFRLKGTLVKHMLVHSDEKAFECAVCSARFRRKDKLQEHEVVHSKEKPFHCEDCPAKFARLAGLREHLSVHTGERPFQCNQCPASFRLKSMLRSHQVVHITAQDFRCEVCSRAFRTKLLLQSHRKAVHAEEKSAKCSSCAQMFSSSALLQQHVMTHKKPFECPSCSKGFSRKYQLEAHLEGNSQCHCERSQCHFCSKAFIFKSSLELHERQHTRPVNHRCQECGMVFVTAARLRVHIRMQHMEDSPLRCTICGKAFPEMNLLRRHLRTHRGSAVQPCVVLEPLGKQYTIVQSVKADAAANLTLLANPLEY